MSSIQNNIVRVFSTLLVEQFEWGWWFTWLWL